MNIHEVKDVFSKEFGDIAQKFVCLPLKVEEALRTTDERANRPGVYLFWHPKFDVIMVGKHQANAKKRALEHIRDNTRNDQVALGTLKDDPELYIYLFNIDNNKDKHWVLALEAFFEWNIQPTIKAHRMG